MHRAFLQILLSATMLLQTGIAFNDDLLRIGLVNYFSKPRQSDLPQSNTVSDFIIVGAGPAGCVLANRLSENPNWSVYLLEAGGIENIFHRIPLMSMYMSGTASNWGYMTTPQKYACRGMKNNKCGQPRGKILGGTSSINFMIYNRGNRRDFDRWSSEGGAAGWSYAEVLPYFLKSENSCLNDLSQSPYHNRSGPLNVEYSRWRTQLVDAYVRGAEQAGYPRTDYNGESQLGVSYVQSTMLNGQRHSAARAYIDPVRHKRRNLHILTFAHVTRILIDPNTMTAYGVKFLYKGRMYKIRARKEVILSAGAFNSPQLLMLSGIGPAENLKQIGIDVIKDLPVGQILYDHLTYPGPTFTTNTTGQTIFVDRIDMMHDTKLFLDGNPSTILSSSAIEALTFVKLNSTRSLEGNVPDYEMITVPASLATDQGTALKQMINLRDDIYDIVYRPLDQCKQDHYSTLIMQFHPKSVGRLWLQNRNPFKWPQIDPNYFSNNEDIEVLLAGIKESIRISKTPAMQAINAQLHSIPMPGCEAFTFASDDYWRCSIRIMSSSLHHQVGTCRMGRESDPTTVVDSQLKVHGIRRLRVADTGIIPFPPTAHTNAASFMIGEKAADMIRGEWEDGKSTNNCAE